MVEIKATYAKFREILGCSFNENLEDSDIVIVRQYKTNAIIEFPDGGTADLGELLTTQEIKEINI